MIYSFMQKELEYIKKCKEVPQKMFSMTKFKVEKIIIMPKKLGYLITV